MPLPSDQLRETITRAQHNDPEAYEYLYQRYVDALYRYLTIRCNDATLAEEVLGELWLRVVQALPRFRLPNSGTDQAFAAWLYRIAGNLAIDALSRQQRHVALLPDALPGPDFELEEMIVSRQENQSLAAAVATLTHDQREIILLRFCEDYTIAHVAT